MNLDKFCGGYSQTNWQKVKPGTEHELHAYLLMLGCTSAPMHDTGSLYRVFMRSACTLPGLNNYYPGVLSYNDVEGWEFKPHTIEAMIKELEELANEHTDEDSTAHR